MSKSSMSKMIFAVNVPKSIITSVEVMQTHSIETNLSKIKSINNQTKLKYLEKESKSAVETLTFKTTKVFGPTRQTRTSKYKLNQFRSKVSLQTKTQGKELTQATSPLTMTVSCIYSSIVQTKNQKKISHKRHKRKFKSKIYWNDFMYNFT